MELTQEYFDKGLVNLLDKIDDKIEEQTKVLKSYVHESFEAQQTYIEERVNELTELIDTRKEVESVKTDMEKVKTYLKLQGFKI